MESLCHKRDRAKYYATGSLVASGAWYGQGWYGRGFLQPVCLALFSMDADIRRFGAVGGLGYRHTMCLTVYGHGFLGGWWGHYGGWNRDGGLHCGHGRQRKEFTLRKWTRGEGGPPARF